MRATLRIHSLTELVLFIGWSLLQNAREHITSPFAIESPKPNASPRPAARQQTPLREVHVWN